MNWKIHRARRWLKRAHTNLVMARRFGTDEDIGFWTNHYLAMLSVLWIAQGRKNV